MREYLLNLTFTRPDEDNAIEYTVGWTVTADSYHEAYQRLRRTFAHLTIVTVELHAVRSVS